TNSIKGSIKRFDHPTGVAFALNGNYAYVANYYNNTISLVNTTTNSITSITSLYKYFVSVKDSSSPSMTANTQIAQYTVT
ncbi:MAG: hypothetical protein ACP5T6_03770, partial [Candidatus Micrarchaeia archaeon]